MRYLVTGATGLVGSHVADRLLERGDSVRAVVRQSFRAEELRRRGVEVELADLMTAPDLTALVDGVDVIVHCAGVVQMERRHRDLWAVNVESTERLLAAGARAGLRRFVHLSSVAVYGAAPAPVGEDAPKQPRGAYGKSKWAAEEAVWRYHSDHRVPAVALRPCAIYGGRDRHAWPILSRLGRMWFVPVPRGGRRLLDLVHVTDVVEAVVAAVGEPAAVGRAYNVTDGEQHSYRDIFLAYERITGRRPAIVPIPAALVKIASRIPGMRRVRALDLDLHYAIDAARRDLRYQPKVGLEAGLRRMLQATTAADGAG
jgi:nucleoside-diphosphate-sugar epimerase